MGNGFKKSMVRLSARSLVDFTIPFTDAQDASHQFLGFNRTVYEIHFSIFLQNQSPKISSPSLWSCPPSVFLYILNQGQKYQLFTIFVLFSSRIEECKLNSGPSSTPKTYSQRPAIVKLIQLNVLLQSVTQRLLIT